MSSRRLRVMFVLDNLELGGVREVVLSDLRSLDRDRFELGLLTLADDIELVQDDLLDQVVRLATSYRLEYRYRLVDYVADALLIPSRRFGNDALRQIESFSPAVLHFHTDPRNLGLGILASRRAPAALVFTDHNLRIGPDDYVPHVRFVLRGAYRRLYRRYHVISVGAAVQGYHHDSRLLDPSKPHLLLENEIDLERFHPPDNPAPANGVEFIQVGRIHPSKSVDTVLRAFGRLASEDTVRLTLVGPDSMGGAMQRLAAECVPEHLEVRFLGSRRDVPELLRRASVGVLATRREGLPLVVLEMMASGLPVVVSDLPELTGVVSDGVDGLVVPVDDVEALAAAMQRLVDHSDLRRRLGMAARSSVQRRMTGDRIRRLEAFYETVAAHE